MCASPSRLAIFASAICKSASVMALEAEREEADGGGVRAAVGRWLLLSRGLLGGVPHAVCGTAGGRWLYLGGFFDEPKVPLSAADPLEEHAGRR